MTEFYVDYNLYDITALEDSRVSSQSNSVFANIGLMKENIQAGTYGTLEHNFFVLDGSREEFPDSPSDLVYFSSGQTNAEGVFTKEQSVKIQFTESHTSVGLTLYFLEAHPMEVEILWYDMSGLLKAKKTFYPDSLIYFCEHQVEEYWRIEIFFKKALPYHNVKLQYIKYGTSVTWNSGTIKTAKLINDSDPISDKIATDKLTFDFVDKYDDFNVGNRRGLHKTFQRKQSMEAYEVVDGDIVPIGTFFLESSSTTDNVCKMTAIDYKGMLSNMDFIEGRIYNGTPAGTVIDEIMEAAGISEYEVDEETAKTPLYGTLKIQTCQKALREVLFACGSVISTAGRNHISIKKSTRVIAEKIGRSRKFSTTFEMDKYVSDVSVKYTTWTLEDKVSEITKGVYGTGRHTIRLSSPASNMTANAGRIIKQMPYYVIMEIPANLRSEVIIYGRKYVGEELAAAASIEHIKSGEIRNTKSFSGSLLNLNLAQTVAETILDYYQLQQIIKVKYIRGRERVGDWAEIENPVKKYGNFVAASESVTTDLTGGFICDSKYRGYYKLLTDYDYLGEIFAGDNIGIL